MIDLITLQMLEKRSVYFRIFTSLKMIKIECSSLFLRFVSQVDSSRLSLRREHSLGRGPTVVSTFPLSRVDLRHKPQKPTTALYFYHFKKSKIFKVHLNFFVTFAELWDRPKLMFIPNFVSEIGCFAVQLNISQIYPG